MTTNLRFYLLHNCENYRNIDFSVINKDPIVISLVKIFIFIELLYSTPKVYVVVFLLYILSHIGNKFHYNLLHK